MIRTSGSAFAGALMLGLTVARPDPVSAQSHVDYLVLTSRTKIRLKVDNITVTDFTVLIPASNIKALASGKALRIDPASCACLLTRNEEKCVLDRIKRDGTRLRLKTEDAGKLKGYAFIYVHKSHEFSAVYSALARGYSTPASMALREMRAAASVSTAAPPPAAPPASAPPPAEQGRPSGSKPSNHDACIVDGNVCFAADTQNPVLQFEAKCKGMLPIVFATDGTTGAKFGPFELSVSPPR